MKYPILENVPQSKEMTTYFNGYSHLLSCQDGAFYDMKNMSTEQFPILSVRNRRGKAKTFTNLQGIVDKEGIVYVDDGVLYVGVEKEDALYIIKSGDIDRILPLYLPALPDGPLIDLLAVEFGCHNR